MPTYIYLCEDCGHQFEITKPMQDSAQDEPCSKCNSHKTYRDWAAEDISVAEAQKTLGSLAEKNSSNYSSEYKQVLKDKLNPRKNQ